MITQSQAASCIRTMVEAFTPTRDGRHDVSRARKIIEKHLRDQGVATHLFETGSWTHGTSLDPYSDVDYFAVCPAHVDESRRALTDLEYALNMLSGVHATVDRPAVRIRFTDGTPSMEIVPAMQSIRTDEYEIPDPKQPVGWLSSAPAKHFNYVNHARDHDPDTKDLVRAVKLWRYRNEVPVSSFYLEIRVARQILNSRTGLGLMTHLARFIEELVGDGFSDINDPSPFAGPRISVYSKAEPEHRRHVHAAARLAAVQTALASACEDSDLALSIESLKQVFVLK